MRSLHRLGKPWLNLQLLGVHNQIAVSRELGHRQVGRTGMYVDGLGASKNQRLTLFAQCVECIKEHSTRSHIERLDHVAFPASRSRIASASLGARPGLVNRSTAAWLAATKVRPPSFHVLSKTTSSNGASSITFAPVSVGRRLSAVAIDSTLSTYNMAR